MNKLTAYRVAKYLRELYEDGDMALAGDSNDVEHDALVAIVDGIKDILDLMGQPIVRDDE